MIAIPLGMHGGPATEALPMHPAHELLASMSGVDVHRSRFSARRGKWVIRKGSLSLHGRSPSHDSQVFPLPFSLCAMLMDSNVNIGRDGNQLLKGANKASRMDEFVLDANSKVFIEVIAKVEG
jgi:hypothetical protein